MSKKFIIAVISTILFVGIVISYNYYQKIFGETITKTTLLFVYPSDNLQNVKEKMSPFSSHKNTFLFVAAQKNLKQPKPGCYLLKKGMSNNEIVNMLRVGNQTPVKVAFNNQDTLEKLAGRISHQIAADSISLLDSFLDKKFLTENNFTEKSVLGMFIPNSYEFYWTISADNFRNRMLKEYKRFWNSERIAKAKAINLTINEVITLASIVQKETAQNSERPTVAGLYLNRLKNGWPLQADPTVIYAIREKKGQDYSVKRVLTKDLELPSKYNTYKHKGLPPTLIAMPDVSAIDAVLNAEKHAYFYMCASIEKIGFHEFSKSLYQHNRNAIKYQRWLSKKGVNR